MKEKRDALRTEIVREQREQRLHNSNHVVTDYEILKQAIRVQGLQQS